MFRAQVMELLPDGGNLNCLFDLRDLCSRLSGTGLESLDPEIPADGFLGMDEEVTTTPWVWMCTMCKRCVHACPMNIDIRLGLSGRRRLAPRGTAQRHPEVPAIWLCATQWQRMGTSEEDFQFVVEDVWPRCGRPSRV